MLNTVSGSPFSTSGLADCLRYLLPNSAILLLEDAVIAATQDGLWFGPLIASGVDIYVLRDDVIARGLSEKISGQFTCVDMAGFVGLTERYVTHIKW